jgi:hypothetical protein
VVVSQSRPPARLEWGAGRGGASSCRQERRHVVWGAQLCRCGMVLPVAGARGSGRGVYVLQPFLLCTPSVPTVPRL